MLGRPDVGALVGMVFGCGLLLAWRSGPRRLPGSRMRDSALGRRRDLLRQAGVEGIGPTQLLCVQLVCGCLAFGIVSALTSTISIAACLATFCFLVPVLLVRRMRLRRRLALRDQWPEVIDNLASAVSAGMSLPEALAGVASDGPADLRAAFAAFGSRYRSNGRFTECLDALKAELADPVGDRVCATIRVAREVGGSDVATVLRTLSELLRADARTRAELETRQGWVVNAARLAVAAPWLVLLLLGTQSQTLTTFDSPAGNLLLGAGAIVCLFAYRIMLRIGRLPDDVRVLR